ncbi:MAG TPA: hypothetical protein VMU57_02875 [Edaphobacter sp.]|uniref:hypothetical protein n=1 Tax=Edaphobacter sp. TaxID=1934404 RepID=UPI002C8A2978|nr:hypothetical protein [Edaphobacter sp.]HUZ93834.1 hypothetical protein [Edaphobacter sp.]
MDLDIPKTTREFLEQVDAFVASVLAGSTDIAAENRAINHFVLLDTFKGQFREFLNAFGLPSVLCDEEARWHEFVEHYSGVIEDGSLACNGVNLNLVDKVVFSKGQRRRAETYVPFDLVWEIFLLDKRRIIVEGNASPLPNGEPMRGWTVRLVS